MERERFLEKEILVEKKSARDEFLDEMFAVPVVSEEIKQKDDKFDFDKMLEAKMTSNPLTTIGSANKKTNKTRTPEEMKEMYVKIKADRKAELTLSDEVLLEKSIETYNFVSNLFLKTGGKEIRFLSRNGFEHKYSPKLESLLLWSTPSPEENIEKAKENIQKIFKTFKRLNGLAYCMYIGGGIIRFDEELLKKNKLTLKNETIVGVDYLVLDFDDYSEDEYLAKRQLIENAGIKTFDIHTGNGYQMFFLLSERIVDFKAQNELIEKIKKLKWNVDESVNSSARMNRSHGMFNCKQYQLGEKRYKGDNAKPIATTLVNGDSERYSLSYIFDVFDEMINPKQPKILHKNKNGLYEDEYGFIDPYETAIRDMEEQDAETLGEIPDEIPPYIEEYMEEEPFQDVKPCTLEEKNEQNVVKSFTEGTIHLESYFSEIPFNDLPKSVRNIFSEIKKETTYDTCMYLAPMFANKLMFSYNQTKNTLEKLLRINERLSYDDIVSKCLSMYETVKEDNKNGLFGKITSRLIDAYGDDLHYKIDEAVLLKNRNKIIINNKDFELLRQSSKEEQLLKVEKKALQNQIRELENKKIVADEKIIERLDCAIDELEKEVKEINTKIDELFSSKDFRLLVFIRRIMHEKGEDWFDKENVKSGLGVSEITVKRNLKPLIKNQLIVRRKSYKKENNNYKYVLNDYKNNTDHHNGYTKIEPGTIRSMLKELGNSELVLYLKLLSMPEGTLLSQEAWGESLGIERKTINKIFIRLQEGGWIRIIQVFIDAQGNPTTDKKNAVKIMTRFILNYL